MICMNRLTCQSNDHSVLANTHHAWSTLCSKRNISSDYRMVKQTHLGRRSWDSLTLWEVTIQIFFFFIIPKGFILKGYYWGPLLQAPHKSKYNQNVPSVVIFMCSTLYSKSWSQCKWHTLDKSWLFWSRAKYIHLKLKVLCKKNDDEVWNLHSKSVGKWS